MNLTKKPVPDNTQRSQQTAPGEIRTRNPSKRTTEEPRLRQRVHWDRPLNIPRVIKSRTMTLAENCKHTIVW
jgi:hypothetical protein